MRISRMAGGLLALSLTLPAVAQTDTVSRAIDATAQSQRASAQSQQRIDTLDDQTRALLERYRAALWQSQQLNVYAEQLDQLVSGQQAERESLKRQLVEMERTEREVLPLMLRMLDGLEKLVAADLPFLQQERKDRIDQLKRLMANPDTAVSEKYRRVLEAYQIEADYGRSLGAERAEIDGRTVDVLRTGRVGLYAITLDGKEVSYWDAAAGHWQPLERRYEAAVRNGIRMARETKAADLLVLPMPVAGVQP